MMKRSRATLPSLQPPLALGAGFEVRKAAGSGVGLFALVPIAAGAVVTRYAGALRPVSEFRHSRLYTGAKYRHQLNRGTHAVRIPSTDWCLDAWELAQVAAAGELHPGDEWAERGVGGLVNSARGDEEGRPQNCALLWHDDVCLVTTTAAVTPGEELLAAYNW
jgi:hypothetical protein